MDLQKEIEAFEAYMAEKYKNLMDRRQCLNNGGGYMAWYMNVAWKVWQAAKAQAVPKWISVEDELPSDGQDIIAFDAIKHCVFRDGEFLQGYIESDTGHEYTEPVDVTHWIAIEPQEQTHD